MAQVVFRVGDEEDAGALVRSHHYSQRAAGAPVAVGTWSLPGGLFGDRGEPVAACVFSIPPTRWSEEVIELSRLVRAPHVSLPPLSGLIAQTVRFIRSRKAAHLLVSFADATQGHHGGIYQAASWNYGGQRERAMDGLLIDGVFHAGRSCNSRWGTRSPAKLRLVLPHSSVEPHYDAGKHLYWKSVTKAGEKAAERLALQKYPYPKPHKGAALAVAQ